jgi:membrane associated rhomboid family serine protease
MRAGLFPEVDSMIPLSDDVPIRRFPVVNVALIVANFAVWIFYELPRLDVAVSDASFYPCTVVGSCHHQLPWAVSWLTAMFMHGSWDHILGNMLFLAIFGKNVEDAFGHVGYLAFYLVGGLVATATQTAMTLLAGSATDARVPSLGASGAIAAVLGAYVVLYPMSHVRGVFGIIPVQLTAWFFLGAWFLYQLIEANFGIFSASANGGGVAFFAHVGGFAFGYIVARVLFGGGRASAPAGQAAPEEAAA